MKPTFLLLGVIGVLLAVAGAVITLQGFGDVGPQSSFMFKSQTWVFQGAAIAAIGLLTLLTGLLLNRRKQTAA